MSYLKSLEQLFQSLSQTGYLTYNELCIVFKQSGLNDLMINNITQDILKTTSNVSFTDKFNCDQFVYGMLLIYNNFQMDVASDLAFMRDKLNDNSLAELEVMARSNLRKSLPTQRSSSSVTSLDTSEIYTSSHRRKPIDKSSLSLLSQKDQSLLYYSLLKQTLSVLQPKSALHINPKNSPFDSISNPSHIILIIDYLYYFLFNQIYSLNLSQSALLDDQILLLEKQLFLIKDAKKNNYSYSAAINKLSNSSLSPSTSVSSKDISKEEKARLLLQQRMKSLGIQSPDETSIQQGLDRCNAHFKESKPSTIHSLLGRISSLSSFIFTNTMIPWNLYFSSYNNSEMEPCHLSVKSHFSELKSYFTCWNYSLLEGSKAKLADLGVHSDWLNCPFISSCNLDKIKSVDAFKDLKMNKSSNKTPVQSTNPSPDIPAALPVNTQSITSSPIQSTSLPPKNPFMPPVISPDRNPNHPKQLPNTVSQTPDLSIMQPPSPVPKSTRKPPPPPPEINLSSAHSIPPANIKSPPPGPNPDRSNLLEAIRNASLEKLNSSSATVANPSNLQSNETVSTSTKPSTQPESNPLMDQMKLGIQNRRVALNESSESEDNWSNSTITKSPIVLNSNNNMPVISETKQSVSPSFSSAHSAEDIFNDSMNQVPDQITPNSPLKSAPLSQSSTNNQTVPSAMMVFIALYDYDATQQDDLSFKVNDAILVDTNTYDINTQGDSWWYGSLNDSYGWFPSSYVVMQAAEEEDYEMVKLPSIDQGLIPAIALYDYDKQEINDLSITANESLFIIDYNPNNTWIYACRQDHSEIGLIPANYVSIMSESKESSNKIQSIIEEFVMTEQTYVKDIQMVIQVFVRPLDANKLISIDDLGNLFNNLIVIEDVNSKLLSRLQDTPQLGQSTFISILQDTLPELICYNDYCTRQYMSVMTLKRLQTTNSKFKAFVKECMSDVKCRNLDLNSFLLLPMQRITRYNLLIKQLLKNTPTTSSSYSKTVELNRLVEELVSNINDDAKKQESRIKIADLEKLLDLGDVQLKLSEPTKLQQQRILLHEGPLTKAKSGRKLVAFLFSDMLLLAEPSNAGYTLYRKPLRLSDLINLQRLQDDDNVIRLATYDFEILLKASNASSFKLWTFMIKQAITAYSEQSKHLFESERLGKFVISHKISKLMGINEQVLMLDQSKQHIGQIFVNVEYGQHFPNTDLKKYFVLIQVGQQRLKTKIVKHTLKPKFNQILIFSLKSLDDVIKIFLYNQTKYGEDAMVGFHELPLNFLEYYGDKETETMIINVGSEALLGIKLKYKMA
eukprot:NODE_734_length_4708_cov_0.239531.p1 type:complete len:1297 gc:universal NODE_734_length_4708_cov_0.239531:501-4391(+)